MKNIVKSHQIMKFNKMFTSWFGQEIISKTIVLPPKLPYCDIYELIKINCQRNDTFKMLKCFS